MDQSEMCQVLAESEFLKGLPLKDVQKVAEICRVMDFDSGSYLFHQGDSGQDLFIIVEGYVFLERTMNIDRHEGHVVIDALDAGRTLGSWSCLLGRSHRLMSSANCQKPTRILALNSARLREIMLANATFGFHILERLCFLLRDRIEAAYGAMDKI